MATNQETRVGILCDPNLYRKLHLSSLGPQIIIVFHVLIFGRCEMSISVDKICIICAFEINKWFIIIIIIITIVLTVLHSVTVMMQNSVQIFFPTFNIVQTQLCETFLAKVY